MVAQPLSRSLKKRHHHGADVLETPTKRPKVGDHIRHDLASCHDWPEVPRHAKSTGARGGIFTPWVGGSRDLLLEVAVARRLRLAAIAHSTSDSYIDCPL